MACFARACDVYGAHIDVVESLHNFEFVAAHVAQDGHVQAELSAEVRGVADATMHPSTATLLDNDPRVRIRDFGYGGPSAEGQVDVAARVVVDLVVNPAEAELASLATVSRFEPLSA
jgi:hypothetical protein